MTRRVIATGQSEPRYGERERQHQQRDDEDIRPVAELGKRAGAGVPGDEGHENGGERRSPPARQYGGSCAHHGPSALKAFQNAVFAACSSSAESMSGVTIASIVGVKRRTTPVSAPSSAVGEREVQRVEEPCGLVAHHHQELRLHDVELAREPRCRLAGVLRSELEAVGAVDRERVDLEALQRLEDRVAGAAEERDALGDLGRERSVLEEEDVAERVARSRARARASRRRARGARVAAR